MRDKTENSIQLRLNLIKEAYIQGEDITTAEIYIHDVSVLIEKLNKLQRSVDFYKRALLH